MDQFKPSKTRCAADWPLLYSFIRSCIGSKLYSSASHGAQIARERSAGGGGVTVLDFGGGTGFSYFAISPYLNDTTKVRWNVFDENQKLYKIGREYLNRRRRLGTVDKISFLDSLPEGDIDVVHIASTLQYIDNDAGLVTHLAERYEPKYFLMTRNLGGNIDAFVTRQIFHGSSTSCRFYNIFAFISLFDKLGYLPLINAPCGSLDSSQFLEIPVHLQIRNTVGLIFKLKQ